MSTSKKASKRKEKKNTTASLGKPEVTQSDSFVRFYSNYATIAVSFQDMRVTFSEIVSTSKEPFRIEQHATIIMTPEQVKAIYDLLGRNILAFEKAAGKLRQQQKG